jgi:hypothetical protein
VLPRAEGDLFSFIRHQLTIEKRDLKAPAFTAEGGFIISPQREWIDVQVVTVAERESVRVRRYRRSGDRPPASLRLPRELLAIAEQTPQGSGRGGGLGRIGRRSRRRIGGVGRIHEREHGRQ